MTKKKTDEIQIKNISKTFSKQCIFNTNLNCYALKYSVLGIY